MRYKQIRIANAQIDTEKYRILKEEILDKQIQTHFFTAIFKLCILDTIRTNHHRFHM